MAGKDISYADDFHAGGDSIQVHYPEPPKVFDKVTQSTEVIDETPDRTASSPQDAEKTFLNAEDSLTALETCDSNESCLNPSQPFERFHSNRTLEETSEAIKYRFDTSFMEFIQGFTQFCEDKSSIRFNTDMFLEELYFPQQLLNEYVPINVVCSNVADFTLQLSPPDDQCPFSSCTDGLYDYLSDYSKTTSSELILRDHVTFVLNSLQCKKLSAFSLECTILGENPPDMNTTLDRMLTWNHSISRFLSRHKKNLEKIEIKAIRSKILNTHNTVTSPPNPSNASNSSSFPALVELTVIFWDTCGNNGNQHENEEENRRTWAPDWFPDPVDLYWITLMQSQLHGHLRKLTWISAANLNWNDVFQPVIDANQYTLETLHIQHIRKRNTTAAGEEESSDDSCCVTSTVLSCNAFNKLNKLKDLYLRKANCYLVDLQKLPNSLQELCLDDMTLESEEISHLESLVSLKVLRLMDNGLPVTLKSHRSPTEFGVDRAVLTILLHCRNLQELCIWGHRIHTNVLPKNENSHLTSTMSAALANINSYLKSVFNNLEGSFLKSLPVQKDLNEHAEERIEIKRLQKAIQKFGFMDESCIVIHADKM
ncbi:unnamed protein product [Orchesella dallaii]|uniref:Uncharacterized protein n=1 Tax=Orchesella dallaii TaxID=48710 RepID=A0ABP1SB10_9HEXA